MNVGSQHLLYIGSVLPSRSETFVYREVLELRKRRHRVSVATVRKPQKGLGEVELDQLADDAIPIYSTGLVQLALDAASFVVAQPWNSSAVLISCVRDAIVGRGVQLKRRPKILIQGIAALALAKRCRVQNPQVSHIHSHMAHVPTTIAMYAAKALKVPFSFTGHAADLFRDFSLLPAKLRRAKFVSCISEWHRAYYQQFEPELGEEHLPVVRCGVDTDLFEPIDKHSDLALRILAVGRLVEKKGFDTLIAACARLKANRQEFRCDIIGDGELYESLSNMIVEQSLDDSVHLCGAMANHEIRTAMQNSDLVVLPCRAAKSGDKDGIPVVLMEAMSCGVPVISGDLVTIRELIEHDVSGLLVEPGNVSELAEAISRLLRDESKRSELAKKGRERILEEFSISQNVHRLENAFGLSPATNPHQKPTAHEP